MISGIRGTSRSSSSVLIFYTKISALIKLTEMHGGNSKKLIKQIVKAYGYQPPAGDISNGDILRTFK